MTKSIPKGATRIITLSLIRITEGHVLLDLNHSQVSPTHSNSIRHKRSLPDLAREIGKALAKPGFHLIEMLLP
jgi:hypothetical protein